MKKELIRLLNGYHTSISIRLLAALKKQLDKEQVTGLNLQTVLIQDADIPVITSIIELVPELKQISLKVSNLSKKNINDVLSKLSKLTALEVFYLEDNTLTDEAADTFAKFIESTSTLKTFYFLSNKLGDKGIQSIVNAIRHNKNINGVSLKGDNITEQGILCIASLINTGWITQLSLHTKQLSKSSLSILKTSLSLTSSLKFLHLELETVENKEALKDIFNDNHSLTEISFTLTSSDEISNDIAEYFSTIALRNQQSFPKLMQAWNKILNEETKNFDMGLIVQSIPIMINEIQSLHEKLRVANQELLYLKNIAQTDTKISEAMEDKEHVSSKAVPSFFAPIFPKT